MLRNLRQVLIVEDQPVTSMMLEEMAAYLGWEATRAYTCDGALKLLAEVHPLLTILDIQLATTSSLAVAEQCRILKIPIVFITGLPPDAIPEDCQDAPILTKPFSEVDFAGAVQRAIVNSLRHA